MASTFSVNNELNMKNHETTRRNMSLREPRATRSILLSAHGPPGLHARDGSNVREPTVDLDIDAQDGLASALQAHASLPPDTQTAIVAAELDGRPASIHLSENSNSVPAAWPSDSLNKPDSSRVDDTRAMPPVAISAPRARRLTLDLPSSPIEVLYSTDHKLTIESTSPKPCIVPGNALHLIDEDPSAPRSATPPSLIVVGDESEHGAEPETDGEYDDADAEGVRRRSASQPDGARPPLRVRFRSRVRITSGMHRNRHHAGVADGSTPGSSTSDSPSSSISAPLRYQADENGAWGPIGRRLSAYAAAGGGWQRNTQVQAPGPVPEPHTNGAQDRSGRRRGGMKGTRGYNERTPLLRPPMHPESEDEDSQMMSEDERTMRTSVLRREEEAVFGTWPWRIFNRHWWWWHAEPVLCCCCDDPDYEETY